MKLIKSFESWYKLSEAEESYKDYPAAAKANAKKAIKWKDEHGRDEVKGGTAVGWARAHQLAKGEALSRDVVSRMAQFNRHRKNSNIKSEYKSEPWKDKGYIAWLIWGGDEGVDWAIKKMEKIKTEEANESFLNEERPEWKDSDYPDAEGRFAELSPKDLAAWLIKTRKKDMKAISGALSQQVVFNRNEDPEYAEKMEKTRKEVYKQLDRQDLLDNMDESYIIKSFEEFSANKVSCDECDWDWRLDEGGEDPYICHNCGHDNAPEFNEADKKPGPDPYMTGLDDETEEEKEEQMKDQAEMDDDDPDAYKELPGDEEAREKDKVKTSKHVKLYHKLYGDKKDESLHEEFEDFITEKDKKTSTKSKVKKISKKIAKVVSKKEDLIKTAKEMAKSPDPSGKMQASLAKVQLKQSDAEAEKLVLQRQIEVLKSKISTAKEKEKASKDMAKESLSSYETMNEEKAEGDRSPIGDEKIETALKKKEEETGVPMEFLRIIMRRGMAAWKTGHRPGANQQQWGYARVNAFLTKGEGTWGGADKDVAKEVRDGGHDKKLKS